MRKVHWLQLTTEDFAGLDPEKGTEGLGAVGGYKELRDYTELGGSLTVFALP